MTRVLCLMSGALLIVASALAQPPAPGTKLTIAGAIQRGYNGVKTNLKEIADKMPEGDYSFKPSQMAEMRTFGQLFGHVANAQFGTCAAVKGVPNPNQGHNLENEAKTKADIVKALNDSFAFCDDAYSSLTDQSATEFVKMGQGEIEKGAALLNNVVHDNEMYGTAAVYMRGKGLVPPSTERMQGGMGRGGRGRGNQ